MFVVVMGVSGSGKSTVGTALAQRLDVPFLDADDLHPASNVAAMAAGIPLTDEDRWPWLDAVGWHAGHLAEPAGGVVVACSALRRAYRDVLRLAGASHFVLLVGDRRLLEERMTDRTGHFAGADLLDSQIVTLETPGDDEQDVMTLRVVDEVEDLVTAAAKWILNG